MASSSDKRGKIHYPPLLSPLLYLALLWTAVASWQRGYWLVTAACWFPMAHLGHMVLLAFHEAVHYHLAERRWLNELRGVTIGVLVLMPLSVYRHLHVSHHARLATVEDLELWPYTIPGAPRWARITAACFELTLSLVFLQVLFIRGLRACRDTLRPVRRRIAAEYCLMLTFWTLILAAIHHFDWWSLFIVGHLVPTAGAANLQAWRKFIEHMGLRGNSPMTATRSVVPRNAFARVFSSTFLHVNYHGTHHRYGRLHFHRLPETNRRAYESEPDAIPAFPSYFHALLDMLPTLADPRIGSQWRPGGPSSRTMSADADSVGNSWAGRPMSARPRTIDSDRPQPERDAP